jgi:gamma-glutamyltranspeptidase / glutathione hydrolase
VGAVAAGSPLTARAGAEMLACGGNAVDAVVAAAFAASVAEAPLTGPGAGGFLLARDPEGRATVLDFFVSVPGAGPVGRRLDPASLDSFTVPFGGAEQVFHIGPTSVATPGMVAGLCESADRLGSLPLPDLVAPAVRLARAGVDITPATAYLHELLCDMLACTPASVAMFHPEGRPPRAGERLQFPDLAQTLEYIGQTGASAARAGPFVDAVLQHLTECGGLVTAEDLADYRVVERPPMEVRYRDAVILTNPPPSSGGELIAEALRALEDEAPPRDDVSFYRRIAAAGFHANRVRASRKPVGSTTHVSAIDSEGGMAALSSSCGSGSGVVIPGTGMLMNNMLGEEDLNPGGFGLLEPGTRMTSMMAPSIVLRAGEPVLVLGSAGSNRLRSAILQTIVSVLDQSFPVATAVSRPRVHPEGAGLDVEGGVPDEAVEILVSDGHALRRWDALNLFFGGVSAVGVAPAGLQAAGDPRRGGGAAGVTRAGQVVDL